MGCDASGFGNVQVRMLSADEELNEETLRGILQAGHSRVPVHRPGSRYAAHLYSCRAGYMQAQQSGM